MPKLWDETIEAHRLEVRRAIPATTAALVAERGLLNVTMSRIAEQAGIGRATLYKYFPDVEAILRAWRGERIAHHLAHLTAVRDGASGPVRRLEAVLEAFAAISHGSRGHFDAGLGAKKGDMTGPNAVDRGRPGSKIHIVSDRAGLPLAVGVSAANPHDNQALEAHADGHPAHPLPPRAAPVFGPRSCTPTRPTTSTISADGYAIAASSRASPARASTPPSGWAATAGPPPLGRRTHHLVADRLSPSDHPLRTAR
ncbi:AcrR family transcriptional regulator [Saccharothrix coeruleofusca]|nr:AcrR family transcriptional regulator [Saccharothrix coeruleofusca]